MNRIFRMTFLTVIIQLIAVTAYGAVVVHPPFVKAWKFKAKAQLEYYVVSKDTIYFSAFGSYGAVDLATGRRLWEKPTPNDNGVSMASDDKTLYIDAGKKIIACQPRTDKTLWSIPKNGLVSGMAASNGTLYCEIDDGVLAALDTQTHKPRWSLVLETRPRPKFTPFTTGLSTQPLLYRNRIYAGTNTGEIISVDPTTGKTQWRYKDLENYKIVSGLAADAQRLYYTTANGGLCALNIHSGALVWSFNIKDANDGIYEVPLLFKDLAVIGTTNGHIYAVGASDGLKRWKVTLPRYKDPGIISPEDEPLYYSLAINAGQVVAAVENHLLAFNTSGKQIWKYDLDEYFTYCPVTILQDSIIGAGDYELYRFRMGKPAKQPSRHK